MIKLLKNTYSIEIKYNNKLAQNDYVLKDAGITKQNYNSDSKYKGICREAIYNYKR